MSAGDNFVEKVRCLRTLFTLDAVESELVDDEDVPLCVMFEGFVESLISHGSGEFGNHLSGGCIEGAVSERTCAESDGLHEMAFADTGLADENDVGTSSDELRGGELLVLDALNGLVEVPIEGVESFSLGESCGDDTGSMERSRRRAACSPTSRSSTSSAERASCSAAVKTRSSCSAVRGIRKVAKCSSTLSRRLFVIGSVMRLQQRKIIRGGAR